MKYRIVVLSDASVGSIQSTIKSILTEFFPDAKTFDGRDIPPPVIKIVDRLSAKWLGRCIFRRSKSHTTVIELQRSISSDAKTLDRVLCHEVIHHVDFLATNGNSSSHGAFFQKMASVINSKRGNKYVTETSDESYTLDTETSRDITVLVWPYSLSKTEVLSDKLGYAIAISPSPKQLEYIKRKIEKNDAVIFKTRDRKYLSGPKIGSGKMLIPSTDSEKEGLLKMYSSKHSSQKNVAASNLPKDGAQVRAKKTTRMLEEVVDSSPGKIDVRPGTLGEVFEDVNGLCVQVDEYYMYYDSPEEAAEFWAVTK